MSGASPERRIISLGNNLAVPQVRFPPSPYRGSFVGLLRPRQFDGKGRGDGMKRGKRVCLPCPQRPLTDRMRRGSSARVGTLVAAGGGIRHIVLRHAFDAQRRRRVNGRRALELRGIDARRESAAIAKSGSGAREQFASPSTGQWSDLGASSGSSSRGAGTSATW